MPQFYGKVSVQYFPLVQVLLAVVSSFSSRT